MDKVQKINRDFYNKNADDWVVRKAYSFYSEKQFRKFVKYFKSGSLIVDIGCAAGRDIPLFLGIGRKLKYEGLDIWKIFIHMARARYPQLKFYISNILDRKTLPKTKYDGFWAAASMQHIPEKEWDSMLDNIQYVMKKEAIGYFTLPEDRPHKKDKIDLRHFTILNEKNLKAILESHGWKIILKGFLPPTRRTTVWRWYIVRLP